MYAHSIGSGISEVWIQEHEYITCRHQTQNSAVQYIDTNCTDARYHKYSHPKSSFTTIQTDSDAYFQTSYSFVL